MTTTLLVGEVNLDELAGYDEWCGEMAGRERDEVLRDEVCRLWAGRKPGRESEMMTEVEAACVVGDELEDEPEDDANEVDEDEQDPLCDRGVPERTPEQVEAQMATDLKWWTRRVEVLAKKLEAVAKHRKDELKRLQDERDELVEATRKSHAAVLENLRAAKLNVRRLKIASGERVRVRKPKQLPLTEEAK